jgi:hypothetical protein
VVGASHLERTLTMGQHSNVTVRHWPWGLNVGDGLGRYEVFQEVSRTVTAGDYQLSINWAHVTVIAMPCTLSVTLKYY